MERTSSVWQAVVHLDGGDPIPFADFLEQGAAGISVFEAPGGGWTITALHKAKPDAGMLSAGLALAAVSENVVEPALELSQVPHTDWLTQAYAGFPARRIARFYVHGSHIKEAHPPGAHALQIDAATAFGSGEHATTEGCLRALDRLARQRPRIRRALDMGTGSGILAVAIAKSWGAARVCAVDVDVESARVAADNARINRVGARVRVQHGNGYRAALARDGAPFDLIVANILARPLIRMAPTLARRLAPGGTAILSGLLRRQAAAVLSAHRTAGLHLVGRIPIGEWQTLILRQP